MYTITWIDGWIVTCRVGPRALNLVILSCGLRCRRWVINELIDVIRHSLKDSNSHHCELLQVCSVDDGGQQAEWNWKGDWWSGGGPEAVNPADGCGEGRNRPASSSSAKCCANLPPSSDEYGAARASENSSFMPPLRRSSPAPASALPLYLGPGSCSISASFSSCTEGTDQSVKHAREIEEMRKQQRR